MKLVFALCFLVVSAASAVADDPLAVEIVRADLSPDTREITQTGEILARSSLTASFATGGRILAIHVEEGDTVRAGDILAEMESVQQEQSVRAAEAGVSTALADFRQARDDYDRQDQLLERGAATRRARDAAEDALRVTEGALAQARAELARARKALNDTTLPALSDATVTERIAEPGQVVGAAQPVLELAVGDELDAVFDVPEAVLTFRLASEQVALSTMTTPIRTFGGTVRKVSPLVNPRSGTVAVTVGIDAPPESVTYGDAVRGTVIRQGTPRIFLPYTALSASQEGAAVWTVDPETMAVSLTPITIDRFETGRIVVGDGLAEDEMVVAKGAQLLYPGRVVTAAEATE